MSKADGKVYLTYYPCGQRMQQLENNYSYYNQNFMFNMGNNNNNSSLLC